MGLRNLICIFKLCGDSSLKITCWISVPAGRMGRITESGNFILNLGYGDPFVIYFL